MLRTVVAVVALVLAGCANLMPAQPPTQVFANAHVSGGTAVAFSPDAKQLASGGYEGEILLWDVSAAHQTGELKLHRRPIRGLTYSSDGRLISAAEDGLIVIWDVPNSQPLVRVQTSAVTTMAIQGATVITGHSDGYVRIWQLPKLNLIKEKKFESAIDTVAVHDGLLAIAYGEKVVLDDVQLNLVRSLQDHGRDAHDLHFSPDGKQLAAGNWFTLQIWDTASGAQKSIPTEHPGLLVSIDFSPDGKYLVSLGRDTDASIRLWDSAKLEVERRYQAHELCGSMIRFSPDGRYMASTSDDESVRLYDLSLPYKPTTNFNVGTTRISTMND